MVSSESAAANRNLTERTVAIEAGFHPLVRMGPTETTRRIAGIRDSQWIIRDWHVAWWGPPVKNYSSTSLGIVAVHGQREAAGIPPVG
jgi:hypothetical protein